MVFSSYIYNMQGNDKLTPEEIEYTEGLPTCAHKFYVTWNNNLKGWIENIPPPGVYHQDFVIKLLAIFLNFWPYGISYNF